VNVPLAAASSRVLSVERAVSREHANEHDHDEHDEIEYVIARSNQGRIVPVWVSLALPDNPRSRSQFAVSGD
jgi:hypothetical protein